MNDALHKLQLKKLCTTTDCLKNIFLEITATDQQSKSITERSTDVLVYVVDTAYNYGATISIAKTIGLGALGIAATASGIVTAAILATVIYGSDHVVKHSPLVAI